MNIFVGKNGHGKTNFVEAISLLSEGKSFRTSKPRELTRWGTKECSVFGQIVRSGVGSESLGVSIREGKRTCFVDDAEVSSLRDYLGRLILVSFSPSDLALVKGTPQERRSFFDKHLVHLKPNLITHFVNYTRALKNKNSILHGGNATEDQLFPWNMILAEEALVIRNARSWFISMIEPKARELYSIFSGEKEGGAALELKYLSRPNDLPTEIEAYRKHFMDVARREITLQHTLTGPHRDDIHFILRSKDARSFASQGESRSIVLALKLAVVELIENLVSTTPLVVLDDVDSELDEYRREALRSLVFRTPRQVFITGTDERLLGNESSSDPLRRSYLVENGELRERKN